jgi:hypothetical protein
MLGTRPQRPDDPKRALERAGRAIMAGQPLTAPDAAWLGGALLAYADPRPGPAGEGLEALLGLPAHEHAPRAVSAPSARRALRKQRNERLRFIAHGIPGSKWGKATTLCAIVHGTGIASTEELQGLVEELRTAHADDLPGDPKQYSRILRGGTDDVGHDS